MEKWQIWSEDENFSIAKKVQDDDTSVASGRPHADNLRSLFYTPIDPSSSLLLLLTLPFLPSLCSLFSSQARIAIVWSGSRRPSDASEAARAHAPSPPSRKKSRRSNSRYVNRPCDL
jgi:hypothetical protein